MRLDYILQSRVFVQIILWLLYILIPYTDATTSFALDPHDYQLGSYRKYGNIGDYLALKTFIWIGRPTKKYVTTKSSY